jgi:hypothetical protein
MVLLGDKAKAKGACNIGTEKDKDEEAAAVVEAVIEEDTCQDGEGDEGAVWNLHQSRDKCAETEALDNNRSKVRYAAIWDVADDTQAKEQVQLDVEESLLDLVSFQMLVLDACLVALKPFHSNSLLSLG